MAITDSQRRDLFNRLEGALGQSAANTVMELLPNQPADQLVTRTDMHAHGTALRGEMAELRADLRGEMAELREELRGEMAELRTELRTEVVSLHGRIDKLEGHLDSTIAEVKVSTQRLFAGSIAANVVAVVTALAA